MSWIFWFALLPLAAACAADVRWRLVPDWTSVTLFVLGLVAVSTSASPLTSFGGAMVGVGLGIAAALAGFWGWGDAKLFAGASLLAGLGGLVVLVAGMAVTGAVLVLITVALRPTARRYAGYPATSFFPRWVKNELRRCRVAPSIPYAIAITGGVLGLAMI